MNQQQFLEKRLGKIQEKIAELNATIELLLEYEKELETQLHEVINNGNENI